jgi:signal transduction histidine kinase
VSAAIAADPTGLWANRRERLSLFLRVDAVVSFASACFMAVIHLTVSTTRWVAFLAVCVALVGVALVVALRVLQRGSMFASVAVVAGAHWAIALVAGTIAPFAMPVLVIITLLPAALAVPFLTREQLRHFVAATLPVTTAVVVVGTLQDVANIEDDLPTWVPKVVTLVFTPVMAALVALIVFQTIDTLSHALDQSVTSRDELRQAQARLVTASDEARRRIERDLHDGAQQRLTALAIGLGRIHARATREELPIEPEVEALRGHLADARLELRRLAHGLYPSSLAVEGLEAALRGETDRFDLPITVDCDPLPDVPLSIQSAIYFCCLEALQNSVRHASPTMVGIAVVAGPEAIEFSVIDDGRGFDTTSSDRGHGFANMRDRVGAFDGDVTVSSVAGTGTTVKGHIPRPPMHLL